MLWLETIYWKTHLSDGDCRRGSRPRWHSRDSARAAAGDAHGPVDGHQRQDEGGEVEGEHLAELDRPAQHVGALEPDMGGIKLYTRYDL